MDSLFLYLLSHSADVMGKRFSRLRSSIHWSLKLSNFLAEVIQYSSNASWSLASLERNHLRASSIYGADLGITTNKALTTGVFSTKLNLFAS